MKQLTQETGFEWKGYHHTLDAHWSFRNPLGLLVSHVLRTPEAGPLCGEWVRSLSRVWLFETPWTVAHQFPPSMEFSRQEYWSGLPFPSGDLPDPGIEPRPPTLQVEALLSELSGNVWGETRNNLTDMHPLRGAHCGVVDLSAEVTPGDVIGKESTCQCKRHKRHGFSPWIWKIAQRRKWQHTPIFLPGKFHGSRSLEGYSPWGRRIGHNWAAEVKWEQV